MIFDQLEFHNVEAMEWHNNGYKLSRLPRDVAAQLDYGIRDNTSFLSSGVELRFRLISDEVKLHLRVNAEEEAQTALIFLGSIQGGWMYSSKTIGTNETIISIRYPKELKKLEEISLEQNLPFSPWMIRVLLPYGTCYYIGKEGKTRPPMESDKPDECYLAYGSSITHGSLALIPSQTYPFLIAQKFSVDYINQGYAGSAFMEKAMAQYIIDRKDWSFASVEMGINMLNNPLSDIAYEKRIEEFLGILALDTRTIFITDIFIHNGDKQERTEIFRDIVRRNTKGSNLIYTNGKELLSRKDYVSGDLTHPTKDGFQQIADNWSKIMQEHGINF